MLKSKYFLAILSGLSLLLACQSSPKDEAPKDLIAPDKLRALLIDIHIKDAEVSEQRYPVMDSAKASYARQEKLIFKKHKVSKKQYQRSYEYYSRYQIDLLHDIYAQVVDSLSYREKIAKSKKTDKQDKIDKMKDKPQVR